MPHTWTARCSGSTCWPVGVLAFPYIETTRMDTPEVSELIHTYTHNNDTKWQEMATLARKHIFQAVHCSLNYPSYHLSIFSIFSMVIGLSLYFHGFSFLGSPLSLAGFRFRPWMVFDSFCMLTVASGPSGGARRVGNIRAVLGESGISSLVHCDWAIILVGIHHIGIALWTGTTASGGFTHHHSGYNHHWWVYISQQTIAWKIMKPTSMENGIWCTCNAWWILETSQKNRNRVPGKLGGWRVFFRFDSYRTISNGCGHGSFSLPCWILLGLAKCTVLVLWPRSWVCDQVWLQEKTQFVVPRVSDFD